MNKSTTNLLAAVVALLAVATAISAWRLNTARGAALIAAGDLAATRADLADLAAWHVTAVASAGGSETSDFNQRIRAAASTVGLIEHVVSVEPGPSARVRDTDTVRTPVFLRLEDVTLRQLIAFLNGLTSADTAARVTGIDLSAPPTAPVGAGGVETWTADVTLSESALAPAEAH